ncbi:MAG: phosphoribosylglycinamide formyltransferase [Myxococcota bacterium]
MIIRKTAVFVSGRGSNFEALFDYAQKHDVAYQIKLVISDNPSAPALAKAKKRNLPAVFFPPTDYPGKKEYEAAILEKLQEEKIEVIVLAGFMRIVGKTLLAAFPNRILNIHPSLLPSFKGLNAQKQAYDYGVRYSGCSVHLVDASMDTGPVLEQEIVAVPDSCSLEELKDSILVEEHKLYPFVLDKFCRNEYRLKDRKVKKIKLSEKTKPYYEDFCALHYSNKYEEFLGKFTNSKRKKVAVSACGLGIPCRYDGLSKSCPEVLKQVQEKMVLPICPEVMAGLFIPRKKMEFIKGDGCRVWSESDGLQDCDGKNMNKAMIRGVQKLLVVLNQAKVNKIFLKSKSPSCSLSKVYRNGVLVSGKGVAGCKLEKEGFKLEEFNS